MKHTRLLKGICLSIFALVGAVQGRPVDLSIPSGGLGPTSPDGNAVHWVQLEPISFGDDFALPLRLSFDSGRTNNSPDLGTGAWRSPLLHSRAVQRQDRRWSVDLPCGKQMALEPKKGEENSYVTADGEWHGELKGGEFFVSRDDGWELQFGSKGYLVRLRDDRGRNIVWNRDQQSHLLSIAKLSEMGKDDQPTVGLNVVRDSNTGLVVAFEVQSNFGARRYELRYDSDKRLEKLEVDRDAVVETYIYQQEGDDPKITIVKANAQKDTLVWDKDSRKIISDGLWHYELTQKPDAVYPLFTRTGPGGAQEKLLDDRRGTGEISFTAVDGITTIRKVVIGGAANGQVEIIKRLMPDQLEATVLYHAYYDDLGNLTKEIDSLGRVTTHAYKLWGGTHRGGVKQHSKTNALGFTITEEFDRKENLIESTDENGHVTRHMYDEQGRRMRTKFDDGTIVEELEYTPQSRIAKRTDAMGRTTTYQYDSKGNRTKIIDPMGNATVYTYDRFNNITRMTDPLGHMVSFDYDQAHRLIRKTAPDGVVIEQRIYDEAGNVSELVDADGGRVVSKYDVFGRLVMKTDALGRTTSYRYNLDGASTCTGCSPTATPSITILPSGRKIRRVYDADQHVVEETVAFGTEQAATTKFEYDLAGNLVKKIDPIGRETRYFYDDLNQRVLAIFPDDSKYSWSYNSKGAVISETNALGEIYRYSYDVFGNLLAKTDPNNNKIVYLYDEQGADVQHLCKGSISAGGQVVRYDHDKNGRILAKLVGQGNDRASMLENANCAVTKQQYDASGNLIRSVDAMGHAVVHSYDTRNRRSSSEDSLGRVWKFKYEANAKASEPPVSGRDPGENELASEITYPDGSRQIRTFDKCGQLTALTDSNSNSQKFEYDLDGHLISFIDASGNTTKWSFDQIGYLERKVYSDKTFESYIHDASGQLVSRTRPDGSVAANTYDKMGRLLATSWNDGKTDSAEFAYDAVGHLVSAANSAASIQRKYTKSGKLESETQYIFSNATTEDSAQKKIASVLVKSDSKHDSGYHVKYDYDHDDRLKSIAYPSGLVVGYQYNIRGELVEVTEVDIGGEKHSLAKYDRQPDGRVKELLMGNGISSRNEYDQIGRLVKIQHISPTGELLDGEINQFDLRDRRMVRIGGDNKADLFTYDTTGQVTSAAYGQSYNEKKILKLVANANEKSIAGEGVETINPQQMFSYDAIGNRKEFQDIDGEKATYSANSVNQYASIKLDSKKGQRTPAYDRNGNLIADRHNKYAWDSNLNLISVATGVEGAHSELISQYKYDALRRRVGRLDPDGGVTHFVHDGWNVIEEYSIAPQGKKIGKWHVWGDDYSRSLHGAGGIGGLLMSSFEEKKAIGFFSYDSNGNVIMLTSNAAKPVARYHYDAFGNELICEGPESKINKYRFSTKEIEDDSKLVFYGYRYYLPNLGRWPSRDPIEERGGGNLYGMLNNNAVNDVDVLGAVGYGGYQMSYGAWGAWSASSGSWVLLPIRIACTAGAQHSVSLSLSLTVSASVGLMGNAPGFGEALELSLGVSVSASISFTHQLNCPGGNCTSCFQGKARITWEQRERSFTGQYVGTWVPGIPLTISGTDYGYRNFAVEGGVDVVPCLP